MTMHWNNQNNINRNYPYIPRSISTSSLTNHYHPYYETRLPTQLSFHSNPISRYHQTSTISIDLPEPLSYFDDLRCTRPNRSQPVPSSSTYTPPNPRQQKTIHQTRLVTSTIIRERLLTDIEQNINEIDDELATLELQPTTLHYLPPRHVFIHTQRPLPLIDNHLPLNKSKRVNKVVTYMDNDPKTISSPRSVSKQTNINTSFSYIGQYHYAPEIEEHEIVENDPEHLDLRLTANELRNLSIHKKLSPAQFRRKQSAFAKNRAVIFVPQFVVHNRTNFNETTKDFHQHVSVNKNNARVLSVKTPSKQTELANKPNIHDIKSLIRRAPETKVKKSQNVVKFDDSLDIVEGDFFHAIPLTPDSPSNLNGSFFRTEDHLLNDKQNGN